MIAGPSREQNVPASAWPSSSCRVACRGRRTPCSTCPAVEAYRDRPDPRGQVVMSWDLFHSMMRGRPPAMVLPLPRLRRRRR